MSHELPPYIRHQSEVEDLFQRMRESLRRRMDSLREEQDLFLGGLLPAAPGEPEVEEWLDSLREEALMLEASENQAAQTRISMRRLVRGYKAQRGNE